jgi:hypothetical protein
MTRANTTRWYSPVGVMIGDGAMCLQTVPFRLSQRIGGLGTSSESPLLALSGTLLLDDQRRGPMTKPIPDKAEIALEYPDKLYVGTFERSSRFEAHLDPTGIALILERPGADDIRKSIHMHINFGLFADILRELASTVGRIPKDDILHHDQLAQAVTDLHRALVDSPARKSQ